MFDEQTLDDVADLGANAVAGDGGDTLEIEGADELTVDLALQFEGAVRGARGA
jgi:hypothetical protein